MVLLTSSHFLSGLAKQSPNCSFTTKMVFPKSVKSRNSGSDPKAPKMVKVAPAKVLGPRRVRMSVKRLFSTHSIRALCALSTAEEHTCRHQYQLIIYERLFHPPKNSVSNILNPFPFHVNLLGASLSATLSLRCECHELALKSRCAKAPDGSGPSCSDQRW